MAAAVKKEGNKKTRTGDGIMMFQKWKNFEKKKEEAEKKERKK